MDRSEAEVSRLLVEATQGNVDAETGFASLLYTELRALAERLMRTERRDHTLQPTALVNEAYVRLLGNSRIEWNGRAHFYAVAARQMRHILIDAGRRRPRKANLSLIEAEVGGHESTVDLLSLDEALHELMKQDQREATVVELKFFGGMSDPDIAKVLGISERTVRNDWRHARAWLCARMGCDPA